MSFRGWTLRRVSFTQEPSTKVSEFAHILPVDVRSGLSMDKQIECHCLQAYHLDRRLQSLVQFLFIFRHYRWMPYDNLQRPADLIDMEPAA
ncbi:hypothetical protein BG57_05430 [Caballeronia grimmiae]|uniref:Uncharacterized protein n=1 Tax=Caballeronia grimmiae TaxID=1071679 RepID=A0A069P3P9_9BURK|nr:hypothetical protein BG57_05430 [Caballeronia grimmiae]